MRRPRVNRASRWVTPEAHPCRRDSDCGRSIARHRRRARNREVPRALRPQCVQAGVFRGAGWPSRRQTAADSAALGSRLLVAPHRAGRVMRGRVRVPTLHSWSRCFLRSPADPLRRLPCHVTTNAPRNIAADNEPSETIRTARDRPTRTSSAVSATASRRVHPNRTTAKTRTASGAGAVPSASAVAVKARRSNAHRRPAAAALRAAQRGRRPGGARAARWLRERLVRALLDAVAAMSAATTIIDVSGIATRSRTGWCAARSAACSASTRGVLAICCSRPTRASRTASGQLAVGPVRAEAHDGERIVRSRST